MPYILTENGDRLIVESGLFALVTEDTSESVLNAVLMVDARPRAYVRQPQRMYVHPATSRLFTFGV